jgi:hypothetical protein
VQALLAQFPDTSLHAKAETRLGLIKEHQGELGLAQGHYERALAMKREMHLRDSSVSDLLLWLAGLHKACNRYDRAVDLYGECLAVRKICGVDELAFESA